MPASTIVWGWLRVGGHSEESKAPRRPELPAPTKSGRPPRRSFVAISSIAPAMCGNTCWTASATFASSALITCTISRGLIRSIAVVDGFTFSVSSTFKGRSMRVFMYFTSGLQHLCGGLRHQLFAPHMGIERVLVPAIHGFSVLNRLVTFCIGSTACEKYRATNGDFQELRLFVACQACL